MHLEWLLLLVERSENIMFIESLKGEVISTAGKSSETSKVKWRWLWWWWERKTLREDFARLIYCQDADMSHMQTQSHQRRSQHLNAPWSPSHLRNTYSEDVNKELRSWSTTERIFWRSLQAVVWLGSCRTISFPIPKDSLGRSSRSRNRPTMYSNREEWVVD